MGVKISLDQARAQGETTLYIYCVATPAQGAGCHHAGQMPIADAIVRFGGGVALDDLPFVCSKCGARRVDVRAEHARGIGGNPL